MSIHFVNISEAEFLSKKLLYKYMPLESALSTINDKYIWFANPAIWKDPFEKRFIEAKYRVGDKEVVFPIKGQVFCNCMTQTATSEAYWNAYHNGQLGISFKFKRERILEVLEKITDCEVFVGKVIYLRTNDIKKKISEIDILKELDPFTLNNRELQIRLLLLKRIAFLYENEIRVLIVKSHKTKETGIKIPYLIKPEELIDTITLDPSIGKNTEVVLKDLFKNKYGFKKVYKSQIYSMPAEVKIEF